MLACSPFDVNWPRWSKIGLRRIEMYWELAELISFSQKCLVSQIFHVQKTKCEKYFHPRSLFLPVLRSPPTPVPDAVLSPWVQNTFNKDLSRKLQFPPYLYKLYFHLTKYISITPKCISISQNIFLSNQNIFLSHHNVFPLHKIYFHHTKIYFNRTKMYFHLTK